MDMVYLRVKIVESNRVKDRYSFHMSIYLEVCVERRREGNPQQSSEREMEVVSVRIDSDNALFGFFFNHRCHLLQQSGN